MQFMEINNHFLVKNELILAWPVGVGFLDFADTLRLCKEDKL